MDEQSRNRIDTVPSKTVLRSRCWSLCWFSLWVTLHWTPLCRHIHSCFVSLSRWPWSHPLNRNNIRKSLARNPLHGWRAVAFMTRSITRSQVFNTALTVSLLWFTSRSGIDVPVIFSMGAQDTPHQQPNSFLSDSSASIFCRSSTPSYRCHQRLIQPQHASLLTSSCPWLNTMWRHFPAPNRCAMPRLASLKHECFLRLSSFVTNVFHQQTSRSTRSLLVELWLAWRQGSDFLCYWPSFEPVSSMHQCSSCRWQSCCHVTSSVCVRVAVDLWWIVLVRIVYRNLATTNQVPCHSSQQQQCQHISFRCSWSNLSRSQHHVHSV